MSNTTFVPEHLKRWQSGSNYAGADLAAYYVVLGRHRDSGILANSNFDVALDRLEAITGPAGEADDAAPLVVGHFGHWAVGWTELLLVRHDAPEALLREADDIVAAIESYPVLDEDEYSERQCEMESEDFDSYGDDDMADVLARLAAGHAGAARGDETSDALREWARSDALAEVRRVMFGWACSQGHVEDPAYPDDADDVRRALEDYGYHLPSRTRNAVLRRIGAAPLKSRA